MTASTAKPSKRSSPKAVEFPPLLSSSSSAAAASSSSSAKPVAHRLLRKGSVGKPPLVPLTEARQYQHERSASRGAARETESEKWDANPDNASAARDGRQFAVANVGNHGRIYLRYVKLLYLSVGPRKPSSSCSRKRVARLALSRARWNAHPGLAYTRKPPETLTSTTNTGPCADLQTLGPSKQFSIADPADFQPAHDPSAILSAPTSILEPKSHTHQACRCRCHAMGQRTSRLSLHR